MKTPTLEADEKEKNYDELLTEAVMSGACADSSEEGLPIKKEEV